MINQFVKEIYAYEPNIDAMQMAEVLWFLSEVLEHTKKKQKEVIVPDKSLPKIQDESACKEELPRYIEYRIVISTDKSQEAKEELGIEKSQNSGIYGTPFTDQVKLPDISKQFQHLKIKQKSVDQSVLDEDASADYIAITLPPQIVKTIFSNSLFSS